MIWLGWLIRFDDVLSVGRLVDEDTRFSWLDEDPRIPGKNVCWRHIMNYFIIQNWYSTLINNKKNPKFELHIDKQYQKFQNLNYTLINNIKNSKI